MNQELHTLLKYRNKRIIMVEIIGKIVWRGSSRPHQRRRGHWESGVWEWAVPLPRIFWVFFN